MPTRPKTESNPTTCFTIFFPFMYCQGLLLGLATNTTIKCSKLLFTKCPAGQNMENTTEHGIYPFLFTKCNLWVSQH